MTWKQFWCKHIWKELSSEYLRKGWDYNWYHERYMNYKYWATTNECIKCHKVNVSEEIEEI
jgi:hypothetical protein